MSAAADQLVHDVVAHFRGSPAFARSWLAVNPVVERQARRHVLAALGFCPETGSSVGPSADAERVLEIDARPSGRAARRNALRAYARERVVLLEAARCIASDKRIEDERARAADMAVALEAGEP